MNYKDLKDKISVYNWNHPQFNRYGYCHVHKFCEVNYLNYQSSPIDFKINNKDIMKFKIKLFDNSIRTFDEYLKSINTDGIIVYKNDEIICEEYYGFHKQNKNHLMMSVSKSLTSLLLLQLIHTNILSYDDLVINIIPELKDNNFCDITIRNLLDMQVDLDFNEDYNVFNSDIWKYGCLMGFNPLPIDLVGPDNIVDYLCSLKACGVSESLNYLTPISDLIHVVLVKVTNKSLNLLFEEFIFKKIGYHVKPYFICDKNSFEVASAGMCLSLRDCLNIGILMLKEGIYKDKIILDKTIFEEFKLNKNKYVELYAKSSESQVGKENWYYKNQIWFMNTSDNDYAFIGINGQVIYVNPKKNIVVVKQGSSVVGSGELLGLQINVIKQVIDQV